MLKVGQMSYVNVAPFFHFWRDSTLEFIKGPPRFLGQLAREGKIDLAPLPTYDCFVLGDLFEPLGNFGIAATRRVLSVFLFSMKPVEQLERSVIALTSESATSVNLLKLLLRERYGFSQVSFTSENLSPDSAHHQTKLQSRNLTSDRQETQLGRHLDGKPPDALLLIGDRALEESGRPRKWPYVYDLAQLWNEWTTLPFTFARWVVRKSLEPALKSRLANALLENLERSYSHMEVIAADEAVRSGLPREILLAYLRNFTYRLGPKEEEGIAHFKTRLQETGLLPISRSAVVPPKVAEPGPRRGTKPGAGRVFRS